MVGVLTLSAIAVVMIRRSGTGRRWLAVRANEVASASLGVPVARVKLEAFAVAGFLAGVGWVNWREIAAEEGIRLELEATPPN